MQQYWYHYKLPRLLEALRADHFVSCGNICSYRTNIPQTMIIHDLSFLDKKHSFSLREARFQKRNLIKFADKAAAILLATSLGYHKLKELIPSAHGKIQITGHGLKGTSRTFSLDELQKTRNKYAEGKEYFLAFLTNATGENMLHLLKAFSIFKKRQLSNMQLVLLQPVQTKEWINVDITNYKYRDDIRIIRAESSAGEIELIAASYAAILLPAFDFHKDWGLLSLANNVPLITIPTDPENTLYQEASLYTDVNPQEIAEKMMLIYKNEDLRKTLIYAGKALATTYTWSATAGKIERYLLSSAAQTA